MWDNDTGIYRYSSRVLQVIAQCYQSLYVDGLTFRPEHTMTNPLGLVEFRVDFDNALDGIGRVRWRGVDSPDFKSYRNYGRFQRIVIADILGITDEELTRLRYENIPRLRGIAYSLMVKYLNGEGANLNAGIDHKLDGLFQHVVNGAVEYGALRKVEADRIIQRWGNG